jgi:hypothetical protein
MTTELERDRQTETQTDRHRQTDGQVGMQEKEQTGGHRSIRIVTRDRQTGKQAEI